MKTLRLLGMGIMAVVLCFGLTACSEDDDDASTDALAGKTYVVTSSYHYDEEEEEMRYDEDDEGATFTFNADGTVTVVYLDPDDDDDEDKVTYTLDGTTLTMVWNNDDYMLGTITTSGSTMTYKYTWNDCDGEWTGDVEYTLVFKQQ